MIWRNYVTVTLCV